MKAYEFPVKITAEGKLELPDVQFKHVAPESVARVIVLIEEPIDESEFQETVGEITTSLRRALHEAKAGQTKPITQLWDE